MVGQSVKTAMLSSHDFRRRLARRRKVDPVDYATELSGLSRALAVRVDPQQVVQVRRAAYQYLEHSLASVDGAQPVFPSLPPGVSPFCFPMYVDDRDSLQDWLLRRGIHARVYWDVAELPDGAISAEPGLRSILDRILILPSHQGLTTTHLSAIEKALRSFSASSPSSNSQVAGPPSSI
jgi:dTDP-4-amino-4,6-dideoxygalactose transaminase